MDKLQKQMEEINQQSKKCYQLIRQGDAKAKKEVLKHTQMLIDQIDSLKQKHEELVK